jgi:hypothetical protein
MNDFKVYEPKNLESKESKFINVVLQKLAVQFGDMESKIDSFKSTLTQFVETIADHVNMSLERADIITKYYKDEETVQPHNQLPGIVSVPQQYNIAEVRGDNEKIKEINALIEKLEDQRNITTKMIKGDYEAFVSSYTKAMALVQDLVESLISLEGDLEF